MWYSDLLRNLSRFPIGLAALIFLMQPWWRATVKNFITRSAAAPNSRWRCGFMVTTICSALESANISEKRMCPRMLRILEANRKISALIDVMAALSEGIQFDLAYCRTVAPVCACVVRSHMLFAVRLTPPFTGFMPRRITGDGRRLGLPHRSALLAVPKSPPRRWWSGERSCWCICCPAPRNRSPA